MVDRKLKQGWEAPVLDDENQKLLTTQFQY